MAVRGYDPPLPEQRGHVVSVWGSEKKGKTHFAFDFPEPVRMCSFDLRHQEALEWFLLHEEKDIKVVSFPLGEEFDRESWPQLLLDFRDTYHAMLEEVAPHGGTVVLDTATQVWQLVQAVNLEAVKAKRLALAQRAKPATTADEVQLYPYDYQTANLMMGGLLRRVRQYPTVNAVFVHRCKDEYVRADRTGRIVFAGFGETPAIVQLNLHLYTEAQEGEIVRMGRIDSCGANISLEGMTVQNPQYELVHSLLATP